jgi:integrase-like protein
MSSNARGRARPDSIAEPDVLDNLASFTRHLRAENKAPSTIVTYSKAVEQFETFLAEPRRRRPRRVADVRRADVEAFLVDRQDAGMRPATLSQRFRSLQQFFKWLAAEGEINGSPYGDDAAAARARDSPARPSRGRASEAPRRLRRDRLRGPTGQRDDPALPTYPVTIRLIIDRGRARRRLGATKVDSDRLDKQFPSCALGYPTAGTRDFAGGLGDPVLRSLTD